METIWILGDQLSLEHAALAETKPAKARVLIIEAKARGSQLRYHKLKLVLVYSAMRHFARDLRGKKWKVDYHQLEDTPSFEDGLKRHLKKYRPSRLVMAEPNSRRETETVTKLAKKLDVPLEFVGTAQFLVSRSDFREWAGDSKRLVMENFYRRVRKEFGWLMDKKGKPVGGEWNYDSENRATHAAWEKAGAPRSKSPKRAKPDKITREVMKLVAKEFKENPGAVEDFWLPVDRKGAQRWLREFIRKRLPDFGAYEDMMTEGEPYLFHSVLSPMLNLGLLTPRECIESALAAYEKDEAPLNSVEGFVRQIAGWREFINGVYWLRGPEYSELNSLDASRSLPGWIYDGETEMNCLHQVVEQTRELGWNHHIQRLMILGNFFLLTGTNPQEALRWFNEMYVDAYEWVMAANVIGMALHADGGFMATKPYAAGSGYIRKMSNYCKGCAYDPDEKTGADACPFNYLYWNFIDEHAARFQKNPRMRTMVNAWMKRSDKDKKAVRESARKFLDEDPVL